MSTSIGSTSSGSISSTGIGSGLDVNTIVSRLMAVESRPLTLLQGEASTLNTTLSTMGKLQSNFSALADKASALTAPALWNSVTASSSDSASVAASAASGASAGSFAVAVSRLASGQTLTSAAVADSASALSSGTLTIELGSWADGGFSAKSGSSAVSIDIGDGQTSLAAIRDKINAAGAGVTAAIVSDATGARLSLRSAQTGAENAFRVQVSETSPDGDPNGGLSMLAYDATDATASSMTRSGEAGNAEATVNGIAVSSASNILSNVVDGLTLTLNKTTSSEVQVNVAADTTSIKKAITDFVSSFNTLTSFIQTQTAYNADSKTAGALQGDQSTLSLQAQLRAVVNTSSSASGAWSVLSQIGLTLNRNGGFDTDNAKLDSALGNLPELKKMLSADGGSTDSTGFARRFQRLTAAALSIDGVLSTRSTGLRSTIDRNSKSQEAMQARLAQTEARMRAQYQALDTKMASLTSLSNYMTQQIARWAA